MLLRNLQAVTTVYFLSVAFAASAQTLSSPESPIVLNTLWRISFGPDYTSTVDPSERDEHAPYAGLYYVPSAIYNSDGRLIPGLQPLYRLLNGSHTDHMDSLSSTEGGYSTEGVLGYVWTSAFPPGLSGVMRIYDNQPQSYNAGDHAIKTTSSLPVVHSEAFSYYLDEGDLGQGYARFPGTDQELSSVSGGGITVKSNLATGCAVWEWWYNGIEIINDYDYGRQLQASMSPANSESVLGEAGDQYGSPDINVDARHPSPCLSISTTGTQQSTAAIPLDWNPSNFGGDKDHPAIYPNVTIGKTVSLDWIGPDNIDHNWPVALYETRISTAQTIVAQVEAPTGYLVSAFNNYYKYDPSSKKLTQIPQPEVAAGNPYNVSLAGPQCIILAAGSAANSIAMGIYIDDPNSGFVLYDNSFGSSHGEYGSNFAKWSVVYDGGISSGEWTYRTWITTDSLQNVISHINQLYAWNVTSR